MSNTLNLGDGKWAAKEGSLLAYNSENGNYKPLPFNFSRDSKATVVNKDGLIKTVGSGQPRIDYKDDSKGAMLLEPQRTNVITYSEAFSNSYWAKSNASVVSGFTSPDGTTNAFKLVENSNNSSHILYKNNITTGSGKTTLSIKAKAGERKWILLGDFEQGNRVYFDLENGVAGTVLGSPNSYSITALQNGWYDITLTTTATTKIDFQVYLATGNNQEIYQGDGTSGVYIFGAQLEQGSYATSYIPTQGSTVTRLADACNNGGNDQVFNSEEGTLYFEGNVLDNDLTYRQISLSETPSGNDVLTLDYSSSSNGIRTYFRVNGTAYSLTYVLTDSTQKVKIAVRYTDTLSLWVNGVQVASTPTPAVSTNFDNLSFDNGSGGGNFYGKTKDVRVYNTALTDAELIALTS